MFPVSIGIAALYIYIYYKNRTFVHQAT